MKIPRRRQGAAGSRNTHQVSCAPNVDGEEGVKDGRHQDRAPGVGLELSLQVRRAGRRPERRAERRARPQRLTELPRQLDQRVTGRQLSLNQRRCPATVGLGRHVKLMNGAAGPLDQLQQRLLVAEVLEQRHDVGERLVERGRVRAGRLEEEATLAIDEGVRRLVGDDVVREAGEDGLAGQVHARIGAGRLEIAEHQRT